MDVGIFFLESFITTFHPFIFANQPPIRYIFTLW